MRWLIYSLKIYWTASSVPDFIFLSLWSSLLHWRYILQLENRTEKEENFQRVCEPHKHIHFEWSRQMHELTHTQIHPMLQITIFFSSTSTNDGKKTYTDIQMELPFSASVSFLSHSFSRTLSLGCSTSDLFFFVSFLIYALFCVLFCFVYFFISASDAPQINEMKSVLCKQQIKIWINKTQNEWIWVLEPATAHYNIHDAFHIKI